MATSKKRGKKTPAKAKAKTKAKTTKKTRPKPPQKSKAKVAKKVKKAPAKTKAKTTKKAKPKAASKAKTKAPGKIKTVSEKVPEKEITRSIPKATRASRDGAAVSNTTLDRLYLINDSDDMITLEIKVGDKGQTGDMTVKLDDTIITEEHPGDLSETDLGTNKDLAGKKLSIVATIADTSRETNLTSLTISLKGGFAPSTFPLSKEVSQEGESVDYMGLIEFFKPD